MPSTATLQLLPNPKISRFSWKSPNFWSKKEVFRNITLLLALNNNFAIFLEVLQKIRFLFAKNPSFCSLKTLFLLIILNSHSSFAIYGDFVNEWLQKNDCQHCHYRRTTQAARDTFLSKIKIAGE